MNEIEIRVRKVLNEYEIDNPMSNEEREALYEWLMDGNSIYDNPYLYMDEYGNPMKFLLAYRIDEEIRDELEQLDEKERANYITRLCGEDTIDTLKEDLEKTLFRLRICEKVLVSYGLLDKVEEQIKECEIESLKMDKWLHMNQSIDEELPFNTGGK